MGWNLLIIFLLLVTIVCLVIVLVRPVYGVNEFIGNMKSPLDWVMFLPPSTKYTGDLVDLWIPKDWDSNGSHIPCIYLNSPENHKLIIYSHGNAENLLNCKPFLENLHKSLKVNVLAWDYSGYGLHTFDENDRRPEIINKSLERIVLYMYKEYNYDFQDIVLWGYSLGSGPSLHTLYSLESNQKITLGGGIIMGGYSSIGETIKYWTNEKVSQLFQPRWSNISIVDKIHQPLLFIHGSSDKMIPVEHAQALHEKSKEYSELVIVNCGHTTFSWSIVMQHVRTWFDKHMDSE